MANWGIAMPLAAAASYATVGGADVTCTAGTEVTVITTGALVALDPGPFYPVIWCALAFLMGATPSAALVVAFKLGAGSDVDTYTVAPAQLVANATILIAVPLVGVNSKTAWTGAGSTINITATATTTACTCKNVGSRAVAALFRGPDL